MSTQADIKSQLKSIEDQKEDKIFEKLAEEALSPLEEITLIQENNISNNIDASKAD